MHINRNKLSLLAWGLFAMVAVLAVIGLADTLTNRPADDNLLKIINDLLWGTLGVQFAFLAALILNRQPRNVIGWLMMLIAWTAPIEVIVNSYLDRFPVPPAVPSLQILLALAVENFIWVPLIFPLFAIMLLFPDGRPPSPRWRWIIYIGLAMIAFLIVFGFFISPTASRANDSKWLVNNPMSLLPAGFEFPIGPWSAVLVILTLLCVAAPFVRYRRSSGLEREQIKWLFYGCGLFALGYIPAALIPDTYYIASDIGGDLFVLGLMAIPIAIAIAILRFRLYDINVIIRKTLIYTAMTVLLATIYFGSVLLLQSLFEAISGQGSHLIIVISTLLIAALFAPLRKRVQAAIDRRFFRQKYNAQQVLARFTQTARDEVELEALTAALARVTSETVQPQSISVWLRDKPI